jgi:hypothetical protein
VNTHPEAYYRTEHLKGFSLGEAPLALPINTILSWKGLQETNTPAYYKNSQLTAVNIFITLSAGVKVKIVPTGK